MTSSHRSIISLAAAACCLLVSALLAGQAAAAPDYRSLSFVDSTHGWVAGIDDDYNSTVWRTTDGGQTWVPVRSQIAAGAGIGWVSFVSQSTGVWGYGSVVRTVDGGDVWSPTVTVGGSYNEAAFAGDLRGWAVWSWGTSESGGGVARTDDGGATWAAQLDRPGPDGSGGFSRVSAPSTKRCYALKWGARAGVYATADAGSSWKRRALPAFPSRYKYYRDLDFPGARVGWAVGDSGRIVKTSNAGAGWTQQRSGCTASLTAVDFVSPQVGYVAGTGGRVLKTTDGGRTWKRLQTGTHKGLQAVCFFDRTHGWVAGDDGALLRTSDGGRSWAGVH